MVTVIVMVGLESVVLVHLALDQYSSIYKKRNGDCVGINIDNVTSTTPFVDRKNGNQPRAIFIDLHKKQVEV